jgi:hypothetical protein
MPPPRFWPHSLIAAFGQMPRPARILLDNRGPGCKLSLAQSSRANLPHCRLGRPCGSALGPSNERRTFQRDRSLGRSSEVGGNRLRNLCTVGAARAAFGGELLNEASRDSLSPGRFVLWKQVMDGYVEDRADKPDGRCKCIYREGRRSLSPSRWWAPGARRFYQRGCLRPLPQDLSQVIDGSAILRTNGSGN